MIWERAGPDRPRAGTRYNVVLEASIHSYEDGAGCRTSQVIRARAAATLQMVARANRPNRRWGCALTRAPPATVPVSMPADQSISLAPKVRPRAVSIDGRYYTRVRDTVHLTFKPVG